MISGLAVSAQGSLDCATSTVSACNGTPSFPFTQNTSGSGYGAVMDLPNNSTSSVSNPATNPASSNMGCLLAGEMNATWVTINISSSGTLEFNISQPGGFEDWAMWPITSPGTSCAQIANNQLAPVRCNWNCSSTGGTGIGPVPAGGSPCNFEPTLNVTAGQSFIVCVSNYSNINATISMIFTGTAGTSCVPFSAVNSQTICPGAAATLSVTSSLGNPTYTWMPGGFNTPSISVSPAATTVYTVSVGGTNTVTSTYTTQVNTGTVTISSLPTLTLTNSGPYCPGSTGVLTATSNGVPSYTWSGPGGYGGTTTSNVNTIPNIQPGQSGVYSVTVANSFSCTSSASTSVSVTPTSTIAVTPTLSTCQNNSFTLTANAPGAVSYHWAGPGGYSSGQQNPVVNNALSNQSGTYTVTAIFGTGSYTCSTRNTSSVTVIPSVTIALSPMPTVCSNGNINLSAPSGASTYTWTGPAGYTSNQQNPVISNASTGNQGTYTLQATTNGCTNSGTINVNVYNALSIPSITSSTVICNKQSTSLTGSALGGSGGYLYNWSPSTGLGDPNAIGTIASPSSTQVYTFTLSDANCTITPSPTVAVTVSVNPLPAITFSAPIAEGCEPFTAQINSQSTPASANCSWKFTNTNALAQGNMMASGCTLSGMLFATHGSYNATLTVTDVNGCIDSVNQAAFITVHPRPHADYDWFPQTPTILTNEVTFTDQSSVGAPMKRWSWTFGDPYSSAAQDSSHLQNPVHLYSQTGTYTIQMTVVNQYGCRDSVAKTMLVDDEFALYIPNAFSPLRADGVNDVFMVKGMGFLSDSFEMQIFDRWGEMIYRTTDVNKGWDGSVKGGIKAKQDVYVYRIVVKDYKLKQRIFTGHVTLL